MSTKKLHHQLQFWNTEKPHHQTQSDTSTKKLHYKLQFWNTKKLHHQLESKRLSPGGEAPVKGQVRAT